jgi:hypothetical protein
MQKLLLAVALDDSQPLWLGCWLLAKAKVGKSLTKGTLSVQNDGLLLKHLDKFNKKENVQWVKLIWDKYYADLVPHLAKEKRLLLVEGHSWLNAHFRGLPFVILLREILLASRMILSLGPSTLCLIQIFWSLPRILAFPCLTSDKPLISLVVSEFP